VELYLYSPIRLHDTDRDSVTFYLITLFILIIYLTDVISRLASAKCDYHCSGTKQNGIAAVTNWRRGGISE